MDYIDTNEDPRYLPNKVQKSKNFQDKMIMFIFFLIKLYVMKKFSFLNLSFIFKIYFFFETMSIPVGLYSTTRLFFTCPKVNDQINL